ncbi:MAG: hypothetical protein K8R79_08245 [Calditrichales bacterium]|nr:hypothetical protein [Calditrichales bacterium]
MRNVRVTICIVVVTVICFFDFSKTTGATTYFEDGGTHVIGYGIESDVWVKDGASSLNPTSVTLLSSGSISRKFVVFENSHITMLGGLVTEDLFAYGDSHATVSGGIINGWLEAYSYAEIIMSGGSADLLITENYSTAILSGGFINSGISTRDNSTVTIIGSNFTINGNPVGYGQYTAADFSNGHIIGTLESGDLLDGNLSIYGNSSIILQIPEPTTFLLLCVGSLLLRRDINIKGV